MSGRRSSSTTRKQDKHAQRENTKSGSTTSIDNIDNERIDPTGNKQTGKNERSKNQNQKRKEQAVPPPHLNNLKPVDSPLRRPRSATDEENSESDDFTDDPSTRTVRKNRKKTKTVNFKESNDGKDQAGIQTDSPRRNLIKSPQQSSRDATSTTTIQAFQANPLGSNTVTDEAKRFAQTRYPFPPFILRLSAPAVSTQESKMVNELCNFIKNVKQLDLELVGFRKSTIKCSSSECDILLFVKNSRSFSILYDETNWPATIGGSSYARQPPPSLPPQLSLIIKNVGLTIDLVKFSETLKASYTELKNVIRLKNKEQMDIKLVKLEFIKPNQRDEILSRGKIFVNSLTYDVVEYLAPARVLICSKCMGIGHFRKQCTQKDETCKKCGEVHANMKEHTAVCSTIRCINCQGNHMASDGRCPKVKQFRADLTKYLLSPVGMANPMDMNLDSMSNEFPPLHALQRPTVFNFPLNNTSNYAAATTNNMNPMLQKLDEINSKIEKLAVKSQSIEDELVNIRKSLNELNDKATTLALDNGIIKEQINNHERITKEVILPTLKLLINFTRELNHEHGKWKNADFGSQIEIYLKKMMGINESIDLLKQ